MRYLALCCDYDGTLATDGRVLPETIQVLERLIASGRRLVLVTGRELDDLQRVCPRLDLFEYVVAENGALLYEPSTGTETALAERPPRAFIEALVRQGVAPLSVGRVIVATWEPHETTVLQTIRSLGLELQVIFNKGAVMVLPAGVTKASGLSHALQSMRLSRHNAVGIGDAENDHALLASCECSAAVANALPTLKEAADIVTTADHGAGVAELIQELLRDDLASREPQLTRHHILLGHVLENGGEERELRISPYGEQIIVIAGAGSPRTSPVAAALMDQLTQRSYTFCLLDPEGHYEVLTGENGAAWDQPETFAGLATRTVSFGGPGRPPSLEDVIHLLRNPHESAIVNLKGMPVAHRAGFYASLAARLADIRTVAGHPHWILIDKAHEILLTDTPLLHTTMQITEDPRLVARDILSGATLVVATGENPRAALEEYATTVGVAPPDTRSLQLIPGEALAWRPWGKDVPTGTPGYRDVSSVSPATRPFRVIIAPQHLKPAQHGHTVTQVASGV